MLELNCLVTPAELVHLATKLGMPTTTISPLSGPSTGGVDAARMAAGGLIAEDALTPAARESLTVLARATSYAGLVLVGEGTYEHVVYFDGTGRVALSSEGNDLRLQSVPPAARTLLEAAFGDSDVAGVELDDVMTPLAATVVVGMIDLLRQRELHGILEDREAPDAPIALGDLQEWLAHPAASSQWLAPMMRDTLGVHLSATGIDEAMNTLVSRGVLARAEASVNPGEVLSALAHRFLIIGMLARLRAGRITGDQVTTADIRIVQSQSQQHLLWEADASGQVHLESVTAKQIATLFEPFFDDPDALVPALG